MNDLDRIYRELGEGICLFPFIGAFYSCVDSIPKDSEDTPNFIRPCSLVRWDDDGINPWYIQPGETLLESRNGSRWLHMREKFLNGEWRDLPDCVTCQYVEDLGGVSPRISNNQVLAELVQEDIVELVREIQENNLHSQTLKMLDYYPSNYCNLECTMCGGGASSSRHVFEVKHLGYNERILVNPADPDFFDTIGELEILGFTGGETVMQPEVHQIVNRLIEKDLAKQINITVLTNCSTYPQKLVDKFKHFKKVMYTMSIDGVGEVIEYQRRGCKWPIVEEVALKIHNNPEIHEVANYVVTSMNILNTMEFIDWCCEHGINMLTISPVVRKEYLGPSSLPPELRKIALERLRNGWDKYDAMPEPTRSDYLKYIEQIIGNIENNPFDPDCLQKFIEHIKKENTASKRPLHEVVPEWSPYFVELVDVT